MSKKMRVRMKKFKPKLDIGESMLQKFDGEEEAPKEEFSEDPLNIGESSKIFDSPFPSKSFDSLTVVKKLGRGEFGEVHLVTDKKTGLSYARKKIPLEKKDVQRKKALEMELRLLKNLDNPNVIKLESYFFKAGYYHILLEYMQYGSMEDVMKIIKVWPEDILSKISKQILTGLQYLHEKKSTIHRDIKPANILVNNQGVSKICDFGMGNSKAFKGSKEFNTFQGTLTFMSPERIEGDPHSYNSDIWSVGLVIAQMALGYFPFSVPRRASLWDMIGVVKKTDISALIAKKKFSKEFVDFIKLSLSVDKTERPIASQLLKHAFIKKYDTTKPTLKEFFSKNYGDVIAKLEKEKKKKDEKLIK